MTSTEIPPRDRRTPSVSELQAALLAARRGEFAATSPATVTDEEVPVTTIDGIGPVPVLDSPTGAGLKVWLLGTHGGSGARCLAAVIPGSRYAGKTWPVPAGTAAEPVVLVCRGDHRGLTSAQDYARAYRDGEFAGQLQLLGVIISADAPGRVPLPLRRLERLLSGAVPLLGHVPWVPQWRLGPPPAIAPEWADKLTEAITAAAGALR